MKGACSSAGALNSKTVSHKLCQRFFSEVAQPGAEPPAGLQPLAPTAADIIAGSHVVKGPEEVKSEKDAEGGEKEKTEEKKEEEKKEEEKKDEKKEDKKEEKKEEGKEEKKDDKKGDEKKDGEKKDDEK